MASSNKTPNYNLPQYAENDTIEFTPEINTAFSTIDAGMAANADNIGLLNRAVNSPTDNHLQNAKDIFAQIPLLSTQMGTLMTSVTMMGWIGYKWTEQRGSVIFYSSDIDAQQFKVVGGVWTQAGLG